MPALKRTQKVLSGLDLIANFVERPLRVGDIVLNDDGQHLIWGNIEDVVDGFSLQGKLAESSKADLKYTSESGVKVSIGGSAGTAVAKGEIEITFNRKNSAFVSLRQITRTSLKLALVSDALDAYWKIKGFHKPSNRNRYHFITETIEAASGTVIFSQEKGNKVVITGKNNTPLGSIATAGEGRVEYVSNARSTLEIISDARIQPLYTAVRFRANGHVEIVG